MTVPTDPVGIELVVVSGLSGAGRSTAAKCLEDVGFFVVDNLPPSLIATLAELGARSQGAVTRLAVVVDVRSRAFSTDLQSILVELDRSGHRPRVLFLEAAERVLVRRFEAVRRAHPLQGNGRLVDGIRAERLLLAGLQSEADLVIDTSELNVHQLRQKIEAAFGADDGPVLKATFMSFGFKYGLPLDADMVLDVRFLPNPYWIPELRELSGEDYSVRDYVLAQEGADAYLASAHELLQLAGAGYQREGKRYLTVAVGCTGGKHRSVAMVGRLAAMLDGDGVRTTVVHRDLGRE